MNDERKRVGGLETTKKMDEQIMGKVGEAENMDRQTGPSQRSRSESQQSSTPR